MVGLLWRRDVAKRGHGHSPGLRLRLDSGRPPPRPPLLRGWRWKVLRQRRLRGQSLTLGRSFAIPGLWRHGVYKLFVQIPTDGAKL
ncbi:hypothetical protein AAC387_Pa10g2003 [Persea americana]